jgi:hypothetical protein
MFLLHCLAIFTIAFWMSAAVGELALRSPEERAMAPGARAGFAFVITLAYFSAAWQFVTIPLAWAGGIALLALQAWGGSWPPASEWRRYARTYLVFLGIAAVYFLPLLLAWTFGPFTEGGGDISIYADTSKYLVDHGLTERGLAAPDSTSPSMNPPLADYAVYRILAAGTMSAYLYTPYAMFSFLGGETNYAVFHGVQCLAYAFVIAACWDFFGRHGRTVALAGTGCVVASLGLMSVFYNTYSAQAISLACCALMLAAIPRVSLFSWAGLRTYGCTLVFVWVTYVHYLGVLVPLVPAALRPLSRERASRPRGPAIVAGVILAVLLASLAIAGAMKSWEIAKVLLAAALSPAAGSVVNPYMGESLPMGAKWLAFAFGFISQQHIWPLAYELGIVDLAMQAAIMAGMACLAIGAVATARAARVGALDDRWRDVATYALSIVAIGAHLYLARTTLYNQAKGAQNVLLLVYAVMVLPLAFAARLHIAWRRMLVAILVAFAVLLLVPRASFMVRFAGGFDRTSILEPSFFTEADRVRAADPDALVLVEPRVSSDLYAASQSFFGGRMLPTRNIVLKKSDPVAGPYGRVASVPEFIAQPDLGHVWLIRPVREPKWGVLTSLPFVARFLPRPPYTTTWKGERLASLKQATVLFTADHYERISERTRATAAPPGFTTVRNGSVSVFVPAGTAATVEVEGSPGAAVEVDADAKIADAGVAEKARYAFVAAPGPRFHVVARCRDECRVRVRLDGRDVE